MIFYELHKFFEIIYKFLDIKKINKYGNTGNPRTVEWDIIIENIFLNKN